MKLNKTALLTSVFFSIFATAQTATAAEDALIDEFTPYIDAASVSESSVAIKKASFKLQSEDSASVVDDYFSANSAQK